MQLTVALMVVAPVMIALTTATLSAKGYWSCPKLRISGSGWQMFWVNDERVCFTPDSYINDNWPCKIVGKQNICVQVDGREPLTSKALPSMKFNDTYTSREHRFSLGIELTSQQCYLSIPVSNALADYEEYYCIDKARYTAWLQDPSAALPMVVRCRRRELDHLLMMQPGTQRGTAAPAPGI